MSDSEDLWERKELILLCVSRILFGILNKDYVSSSIDILIIVIVIKQQKMEKPQSWKNGIDLLVIIMQLLIYQYY